MPHRILPHSPWRPGRARNGKIARLPEKLRETLNLLLLDGLPYDAIIAKLGDDAKHLNYHNLKRWRQGGYQDWLLTRERGDRDRIREEVLRKLASRTAPRDLPSVMTAAVATQYMQFFLDFDHTALKENIEADAGSFISLLNSMAKTAHASIECARLRHRQPARPSAATAAVPHVPSPAAQRLNETPPSSPTNSEQN